MTQNLWFSCSLSAMCIENMDGDYYIPGAKPDGAEGIWKEVQAAWL